MNIKKDKDVFFNTSDMYVACALRAYGFKLHDVYYPKGSEKAVFSFDSFSAKGDPKEIEQDYWDSLLSVDARSFVLAIDEIKSKLYSKGNLNK